VQPESFADLPLLPVAQLELLAELAVV